MFWKKKRLYYLTKHNKRLSDLKDISRGPNYASTYQVSVGSDCVKLVKFKHGKGSDWLEDSSELCQRERLLNQTVRPEILDTTETTRPG